KWRFSLVEIALMLQHFRDEETWRQGCDVDPCIPPMFGSPQSMMMATAADPATPLTSVQKQRLRVLVSDDQVDVREALRLLLKGAGYAAETVDSPAAVLRAVDAEDFDLILMDLNYTRDTTSGQEGLDLLDQLSRRGEAPPIVVM